MHKINLMKVHLGYRPDVTSFLDRSVQWADNILTERQFAVFVRPSLDIFAQRASGNSHIVTVN
jgi:hypothetical protein